MTSAIKPNLFIVGFQKCGSSSLFDLLCKHSEIVGTNPKETFALCDDAYQNYNGSENVSNPDFSWNKSFDVNQKKKYYLEGSVCNFYQERALEYIAAQAERKVIFILRDPVERFVSTFGYYGNKIKSGGPVDTIEKYYDAIQNKNSTIEIEGAKYVLQHGNYSEFIRPWQEKLGEENVYVIGFKNLIKDTNAEFSKLLAFLDLDPSGEWNLEHKNKTSTAKNKKVHYYLLKYFKNSGLGKSFLGKLYSKMNSTNAKPKLSEPIQEQLTNLYSSEYKINSKYF